LYKICRMSVGEEAPRGKIKIGQKNFVTNFCFKT
jgi:hypothetical protein